jgi:type II secretory pathway pseudopilin PulG
MTSSGAKRPVDDRRTLTIAGVVIIVIVVAVVALGTWSASQATTHAASEEAKQQALDYLSQTENRIAVAFPDVTTWQGGESGTYTLALMNSDPEQDKTFYINVYLERLLETTQTVSGLSGAANSWPVYSGSVNILAGAKTTTTITVRPAIDASNAVYVFRVAVCDHPGDSDDCHSKSTEAGFMSASPSIYASGQLVFEISA